MHLYCEKLTVARNLYRGGGLNRPTWVLRMYNALGVENLTGGLTSLPHSESPLT